MNISNQQFHSLISLMIKASENTLLYHRQSSLKVELKEDQSPLTIADQTTNTIICQGLKRLFPEIPIISEENRNDEYSTRANYTWVWLVDPLDGTKEFIKGGDDYTVNIGLVYKGVPVFGLVTQPVEHRLYFGWGSHREEVAKSVLSIESEIGGGSYELDYKKVVVSEEGLFDSSSLRRLSSQVPVDGDRLKIVASKSHLNQATEQFLARHPEHELVNIGSSLKIIKVADNGEAHLYPRLGPTCEWDTAAAHAVLSAAGGCLKRIDIQGDGGKYLVSNFPYNKPDLLNSSFICAHPELLERLGKKGTIVQE